MLYGRLGNNSMVYPNNPVLKCQTYKIKNKMMMSKIPFTFSDANYAFHGFKLVFTFFGS